MKKLILIILIIGLVVLIGTYPLSVLGKIFEFFANVFYFLANTINFFGWNGLI